MTRAVAVDEVGLLTIAVVRARQDLNRAEAVYRFARNKDDGSWEEASRACQEARARLNVAVNQLAQARGDAERR